VEVETLAAVVEEVGGVVVGVAVDQTGIVIVIVSRSIAVDTARIVLVHATANLHQMLQMRWISQVSTKRSTPSEPEF